MLHRLTKLTTGWALCLLDVAAVALAWPAMLLVVTNGPARPIAHAWAAALLYPTANFVCLYMLGLYRRDVGIELRKSLARMPLVAAAGAVIAGGAMAALDGLSGQLPWMACAMLAFLLSGSAARIAFDGLRRHGLFSRTLLIVGAGRRAWDLVWMLRKEGPNLSYRITFAHDPSWGELDPRLAPNSIATLPADGFLGLARRCGADQIVVAPDERRGLALAGLLDCKIAGIPVAEYLSFLEQEVRRIDLKRMELGWLLYCDGFYFGTVDRVLKRTLDLLVSASVLLLVSPFLLAAMLAVKLEDGGPVLYRQVRVTRGGKLFHINKLRTMRVDAEANGAVWAMAHDQRVTRIGAVLRRSRIDELPQLFNVLRGDMSFVGPRPERPDFVNMLAQQIPLYCQRHIAKAGLTGWAQINYPYGASIDDARSKLSYDLYYIKNFSLFFDVLIMLQTFRVVLWPNGVMGASAWNGPGHAAAKAQLAQSSTNSRTVMPGSAPILAAVSLQAETIPVSNTDRASPILQVMPSATNPAISRSSSVGNRPIPA